MAELTNVQAHTQRRYDQPGAPWLVTLFLSGVRTPSGRGYTTQFPQAKCVMDDFGDLVVVWGWQ
jgi:hypothetical protein